MKLGCPICNSKFTLEQLKHEGIMGEMIDLAAKFGKNWNLVYDYTECFRRSQWGSVRLEKRLSLIQETFKLFEKAEFEYESKRYRTDWATIIGALRTVVDQEKFKFTNHNYLKVVLIDQKTTVRLSAEGMSAKDEADRELKRRNRTTDDGRQMTENEKTLTGPEYKAQLGIKSLVDQIGTHHRQGSGGQERKE